MTNLLSFATESNKTQEFDHPNGSVWILGVDFWGNVFVIKPPNIDPSFLEFKNAEDIGLSPDVDLPSGVYKVTMNFIQHRDWESGVIDDYDFVPQDEFELLYQNE